MSRLKQHYQIFETAWPYALSMASGFIIQATDSSMVAPMGTTALAALGVAGAASFIPNAFSMGIITSVQKRVVNGDLESRRRALSANMILGLLMALPFFLIYYFFASEIASLYTRGEAVHLAASYLKIFCISFFFSSMNMACNGYWIGLLKSRTRLALIVATTLVNVAGNLYLAPRYGLKGVAFASMFAVLFSFLLNLSLTTYLEDFRWRTPQLKEFLEDAKIVFGVSLHQMSLALMLNLAVAIIGIISVDALAMANVIGMLSLPALYLGIGYGVATGSFLVKSLGEKQPEEARRIGLMALQQVATICVVMASVLVIFSGSIRQWFFGDSPLYQQTLFPMMLLAGLYLIDGLSCTLQRFHFVSEGLKTSWMIMTGVQFLIFIPLALIGVTQLNWDYSSYLSLHIGHRALIGGLLYLAWDKRLSTSV